jgi:hypothetical protein
MPRGLARGAGGTVLVDFGSHNFRKELHMYRFLAVVTFAVGAALIAGCGGDAASTVEEATKKAQMEADAKRREMEQRTKEVVEKGKEDMSKATDELKKAADDAKAGLGAAADAAKKAANAAKGSKADDEEKDNGEKKDE